MNTYRKNYICTLHLDPKDFWGSFHELGLLGQQCWDKYQEANYRVLCWRIFKNNDCQLWIFIPSVPTCIPSSKSIWKWKYCVHFIRCRCFAYWQWYHLWSNQRWVTANICDVLVLIWVAKVKRVLCLAIVRCIESTYQKSGLWVGKGQNQDKLCCSLVHENLFGRTRNILNSAFDHLGTWYFCCKVKQWILSFFSINITKKLTRKLSSKLIDDGFGCKINFFFCIALYFIIMDTLWMRCVILNVSLL